MNLEKILRASPVLPVIASLADQRRCAELASMA